MKSIESLLAASIRYEELRKQKQELLKRLQRTESRMNYLLQLKERIEAENEKSEEPLFI